jgi:hypothetical protein
MPRRNPQDVFSFRRRYDGRAQRVELRNLREREVLREPSRRELLGGAVEKGEERAARGVRSLGSVLEVRGDPRAIEGVLEERRVGSAIE